MCVFGCAYTKGLFPLIIQVAISVRLLNRNKNRRVHVRSSCLELAREQLARLPPFPFLRQANRARACNSLCKMKRSLFLRVINLMFRASLPLSAHGVFYLAAVAARQTE